MAAPTVENSTTSEKTSTSGTDHTVSLPSGITAGETLIVGFGTDNNPSVSFPSGWTVFFDDTEGTTFADDRRLTVAWRKADGNEGSTITVTTSEGDASAHVSYRISGATDPTSQAPESASKSDGVSSTPDPPQITPSGGEDDYLILPMVSISAEENADSAPTGYSNLLTTNCGTQSDSNETGICSAENAVTASSEDPGTFSYTNNHRYVSTTVAVYPSSSTTNSLPILTPPNIGV